MNKMYLKVPFEMKEIKEHQDESGKFGIIKGYASVFDNIDFGNDRITKGAFEDTIKEHKEKKRQIRMFFQHSARDVIGGFSKFKEDETGLFVEGKINLEVQKGREAFALAKQGVITDFSIGYFINDASFEVIDGESIRVLNKLELFEISLVTNPMNDKAIVTELKSITDVSKLLKSFGMSNKESNDFIYKIKTLIRNEDEEKTRNEDKVNEVSSNLDRIINNIKGSL